MNGEGQFLTICLRGLKIFVLKIEEAGFVLQLIIQLYVFKESHMQINQFFN